jgi:DNA-binding HxlR family transcriptional regulator
MMGVVGFGFLLLVVFCVWYWLHMVAARTLAKVLIALRDTSRPLSVSELITEPRCGGGMIIQTLETLEKYKLIWTASGGSRWQKSTDEAKYELTSLGKDVISGKITMQEVAARS